MKEKKDPRSSYGAMLKEGLSKGKVKDNFDTKINPQLTELANQAIKQEYPNYEPGQKMNNQMTRLWYKAYIAEYGKLMKSENNPAQNMSLREQAMIAHEARHHARVYTRSQMSSPFSLFLIKARDLFTYGSSDGPSFDYLVKQNMKKGMTIEEAYGKIKDSALRTNEFVDKFNNAVKEEPKVVDDKITEIENFVESTVKPNEEVTSEKTQEESRGLNIN